MTAGEKVLSLIEQVGINGLCVGDGCRCRFFEVHRIHVDISCHKSGHCVRVHSETADPQELPSIADAVFQWMESTGTDKPRERYRLRFCAYDCDNVNVSWRDGKWIKTQKCCYCSAPRPDAEAYLCVKCLLNPAARAMYPWGLA